MLFLIVAMLTIVRQKMVESDNKSEKFFKSSKFSFKIEFNKFISL